MKQPRWGHLLLQGGYFSNCQFPASGKRGKERGRTYRFCLFSTGYNLATCSCLAARRLRRQWSLLSGYITKWKPRISVTNRMDTGIILNLCNIYINTESKYTWNTKESYDLKFYFEFISLCILLTFEKFRICIPLREGSPRWWHRKILKHYSQTHQIYSYIWNSSLWKRPEK